MNIEDFNAIVEIQMERCKNVLIQKGVEYSSEFDKLHNFKQAAHLTQESQAKALAGMMVKHTVSIYDFINAGATMSPIVWDEKITDHINYLILLRAIIEEEYVEYFKQADADSAKTNPYV